jgi:hypothetical protein
VNIADRCFGHDRSCGMKDKILTTIIPLDNKCHYNLLLQNVKIIIRILMKTLHMYSLNCFNNKMYPLTADTYIT